MTVSQFFLNNILLSNSKHNPYKPPSCGPVFLPVIDLLMSSHLTDGSVTCQLALLVNVLCGWCHPE